MTSPSTSRTTGRLCPHCGRSLNETALPASRLDDLVSSDTVAFDTNASNPAEAVDGETSSYTEAPSSATTDPASISVREPGDVFGDYEIEREIARGGMGIVYLARERKLRRTVALKVLRAGDGASDEDQHRFLREAEAAASLAHPNIVPIHELNEYQGRPFFTMDYIDGPSLETLIAEERLTIEESVELLEQIALAIHFAHTKGIVHRDLKPANVIMAPDGIPMITDFGLAVNLGGDPATQRMTHSGVVMGTIPYIPPEQAAGQVDKINPRSDVYSLGAILYEMVSGKPPFEADNQLELLHRVAHQDPELPRKLNPKVPQDLQTICLKCLEKPPGRRYRTAKELADDCRAFLDGEVIQARPVTIWYRAWRKMCRHRGLSALAATAVLLTLAFFGAMALLQQTSERATKFRQKAERDLKETARELRQVQEEKEELTASLDRSWRPVLAERFEAYDPEQWVLPNGGAGVERGYLVIDGRTPPRTKSDESPMEVGAALLDGFPGDCQVRMKVYVPRKGGGKIGVLLSGRQLTLEGSFGYLFTVGPPTAPGARIEKGPAVLVSKDDVSLEPERWQSLQVERKNGILRIRLEGEPVLEVEDETILQSDEHSRIGFVGSGGYVFIDDVVVSRPGLSRQMLDYMLDIAENLYRNGRRDQLNWAIEMTEQVAMESNDPVLHLRALRRAVTCYLRLHGSVRAASRRAQRLADQLKKGLGYSLQAGEEDFLQALVQMEAGRLAQAAKLFGRAAEEASEESGPFPLLAEVERVLVHLRLDRPKEAVRLLTDMQRRKVLTRLADRYEGLLQAANLHSGFIAQVDELLAAGEAEPVWNLLEALRVLFPQSRRDLAARSLSLAELYESRDQWEDALDRLGAARAMAPDWEKPVLALAAAHDRRGQTGQALTIYREAASAFPASSAVQVEFCSYALEHGGSDLAPAALKAARRAAEHTGRKDPVVLDLLAEARLANNQRTEAVKVLREAVALDATAERQERLREVESRTQALPEEGAQTEEPPPEETGPPAEEDETGDSATTISASTP
jgi:predicted Ser/Thr protein kinase/Tfp pilus assembly protein PilF